MPAGRVAEIWRYPVKSLAGERLDEAELTDDGIAGDRAFALVDAASGKVLTAKRVPRLLDAGARWSGDGQVQITLPGGRSLRSDDPTCDAVLSDWLGVRVRLERPTPGKRATVQQDVDPDDPSVTAHFNLPKGSFLDSRSSLHILSLQSLEAARRLHPGDWDPRRFRANLLVSVAGEGFVEDSWVGAVVAIGSAEVFVRKPTVRCVLPSRAQGGLPRDGELFRVLLRRREGTLGVYANVRAPGLVGTGAAVIQP